MTEENNAILTKWQGIQQVVHDLDLDVLKLLQKGNSSAGVRARKGLRTLSKACSLLVKETIEFDRQNKDDRKERKPKVAKPKTKK